MPIPFAFGVQFVYDTQQRFVRAGLPCYLRVANFTDDDAGDSITVGVPFSPSGAASAATGFTDILIDPPPSVMDVSLHNIGILAGRLNFGSRIFIISNTFVRNQLQLPGFIANNITDPYEVFRDRDGKKAIGIYYNCRLFAVESLTHKEVAGRTVTWKVIGNALELATTVQGGP